MSKKNWFYTLNIVLPLIFGLSIYLIFRKDTYVAEIIERLLGTSIQPPIILPLWMEKVLRNYLSDFLWSYSLAFSVSCALGHSEKESLRFIICAAFAIGIELLQKFRIIQGTFDVIDVVLELIAISVALQLNNRTRIIEEDKNEKSS